MRFLTRIGDNIATADTQGFLMIGGGLAVVLCLSLFWAFRYLIRARTLEDVPTSKARSAEQGYVELEGRAELLDGPPIQSPLSGRECAWWSYVVERNRNNDWVHVESETSDSLFAIRDETGTCVIDPEGADVFPVHKRTWNGNQAATLRTVGSFRGTNYRFREYFIMPNELICVIGLHKTHEAIDDWNDADEIRRLITNWKKNQTELINRFDSNNDGVLDQAEWEVAREDARQQIALEKRRHATIPGINVIGAPPDKRPFLIAPFTNRDFAKKMRWKALGSFAVSVLLGVGLTYVLIKRYGG
ncbi:MAG: GIDE domain-containing protein [Pseudomonadota bacterium]